MGNLMHWAWRGMVLAILAWGVWGIWWQATLTEAMNDNLANFIDLIAIEYGLNE